MTERACAHTHTYTHTDSIGLEFTRSFTRLSLYSKDNLKNKMENLQKFVSIILYSI